MNWFLAWLALAGPLWALLGAVVLPRRYRRRALDASSARLTGGLIGAALGAAGVGYLYAATPPLRRARHVAAPSALLAAELLALFRVHYPENACNTDPVFVLDQLQNGVAVGLVFATIAVGLTLIYSVQSIVSFAHGQLFMFGGVTAFLLLTEVWEVNAIFVIPLVGLIALSVGVLFERTMLTPMYGGRLERPSEYAILVTFGFGLFLQFALVGWLGSPSGIKAARYTDRPLFGFDQAILEVGGLRVRTDFWIAGVVGTLLVVALVIFLQRTWIGMSLRAVAQDRQAAEVAGINARRAFTLAFGLGTMLAGMAGATLVPVLNFPVPEIAGQAALRSYVIIVLGGLGSVSGAWLGGVFIGVVEAFGAGCFPDASRAASYQLAFPLVMFALVLLVRPRGFFGREP